MHKQGCKICLANAVIITFSITFHIASGLVEVTVCNWPTFLLLNGGGMVSYNRMVFTH